MMQNDKITWGNDIELGSVAGLELVRAKDTIEQFIYSCSHTLRAPLKSINGLVNILKVSDRNADINPLLFLQAIEKTTKKMELVLDELEQFLSNSQYAIALQLVDMNALVEKVVSTVLPRNAAHKIAILLDIQQAAPFYADENRLRVILMHLISNAVTFSDPSKAKMVVRIRVSVTPTSCVIEVSDNGLGISEETMPNIFELFYRGSDKSTGSGAGLYVVREVVNKMHGKIEVDSTLNTGSAFTVSLTNPTA